VSVLQRQLLDANEKLKSERVARTRDQVAMAEEREHREANTEALHKRCLQAQILKVSSLPHFAFSNVSSQPKPKILKSQLTTIFTEI